MVLLFPSSVRIQRYLIVDIELIKSNDILATEINTLIEIKTQINTQRNDSARFLVKNKKRFLKHLSNISKKS